MAWPFWFIYKPDPHSRKRGTHCNINHQLFIFTKTSFKSRTSINFNNKRLFIVKQAVPHPKQSYNSVAIIAMYTDGQFLWSFFVQLLHHQKQLWLSLSGCLFTRKYIWDFVSRLSCWQDFTYVVCNWTLKARLTAVKPFNVCHRQIWEFLRCCVRKGCQIISNAGKQICGMRKLFLEVGLALASSRVQGPSG